MGSSYKLWVNRLNTTDTLTRGQIRQWCNAIAAGSMGFYMGGHHTNLTPDECGELVDLFDSRCEDIPGRGFYLEPDHTRFGYEWLRKDLSRAESLGISEDMLNSFIGFRFTDTEIAHINPGGIRANIVPVYRVLSGIGETVYSWSPWQARAYG